MSQVTQAGPLDILPLHVQTLVFHKRPWSARTSCRSMLNGLDLHRTGLTLHWLPVSKARASEVQTLLAKLSHLRKLHFSGSVARKLHWMDAWTA